MRRIILLSMVTVFVFGVPGSVKPLGQKTKVSLAVAGGVTAGAALGYLCYTGFDHFGLPSKGVATAVCSLAGAAGGAFCIYELLQDSDENLLTKKIADVACEITKIERDPAIATTFPDKNSLLTYLMNRFGDDECLAVASKYLLTLQSKIFTSESDLVAVIAALESSEKPYKVVLHEKSKKLLNQVDGLKNKILPLNQFICMHIASVEYERALQSFKTIVNEVACDAFVKTDFSLDMPGLNSLAAARFGVNYPLIQACDFLVMLTQKLCQVDVQLQEKLTALKRDVVRLPLGDQLRDFAEEINVLNKKIQKNVDVILRHQDYEHQLKARRVYEDMLWQKEQLDKKTKLSESLERQQQDLQQQLKMFELHRTELSRQLAVFEQQKKEIVGLKDSVTTQKKDIQALLRECERQRKQTKEKLDEISKYQRNIQRLQDDFMQQKNMLQQHQREFENHQQDFLKKQKDFEERQKQLFAQQPKPDEIVGPGDDN